MHKSVLLYKLFVLLKIIQSSETQTLEIKNLHQDPILLLEINQCKIQIGNIKIIHPINLNNLENIIKSLDTFTVDKVNDRIELSKIIEQKLETLYSNFYKIKPIHKNRQKRWDALGSTWKWLAGNPDAQDLRIINTTMNDLIDQNNQQLQVNERINQRLTLVTDTVNRAIANSTMANKIILTEIEMMATIMNMDTINEILEDVQDAIIKTKAELTSHKILSLEEIILIKDILVKQGVNISLPDEALQYITPKIAINKETLLYILEVPQLEEENSMTLLIYPLTINNTIIANYPQYLIKTKRKLFTTTNHNDYVQKHTNIKEFQDDCIQPLVMGKNSMCNVTLDRKTTIQYIAEDMLLINNANEEVLSSDCGPDNRTLNGNFLITFRNCSITFDNKIFKSYEIQSEIQEIQGALHNLKATRQLISELSIDEIAQVNIENRKQLQNVYLKQWNHQLWIWSLSGGISISSIGLVVLLIYVSIQKRTKTVEVKASLKNQSKTMPNLDEMRWCSKLLERFGINPKDEDALSSPPGGITTQPKC